MGWLTGFGTNPQCRQIPLNHLHGIVARNGYHATAGTWLAVGTECNDPTSIHTRLYKTSEGEHEVVLYLLLDRGADIVANNKYKRTLLHKAAEGGHEATVCLLLDREARIEAKDYREQMPLHNAVVSITA